METDGDESARLHRETSASHARDESTPPHEELVESLAPDGSRVGLDAVATGAVVTGESRTRHVVDDDLSTLASLRYG